MSKEALEALKATEDEDIEVDEEIQTFEEVKLLLNYYRRFIFFLKSSNLIKIMDLYFSPKTDFWWVALIHFITNVPKTAIARQSRDSAPSGVQTAKKQKSRLANLNPDRLRSKILKHLP